LIIFLLANKNGALSLHRQSTALLEYDALKVNSALIYSKMLLPLDATLSKISAMRSFDTSEYEAKAYENLEKISTFQNDTFFVSDIQEELDNIYLKDLCVITGQAKLESYCKSSIVSISLKSITASFLKDASRISKQIKTQAVDPQSIKLLVKNPEVITLGNPHQLSLTFLDAQYSNIIIGYNYIITKRVELLT
jgi:hypothetical protein